MLYKLVTLNEIMLQKKVYLKIAFIEKVFQSFGMSYLRMLYG